MPSGFNSRCDKPICITSARRKRIVVGQAFQPDKAQSQAGKPDLLRL